MKTTIKNVLFTALAVLLSASIHAQGSAATGGEVMRPQIPGQADLATAQIRTQNLTRTAEFFNILRDKRDVDERGLPTVGSIYIDEEFKPCQVLYKDEVIGEFLYRHNAFNDEIEVRSMDLSDNKISSLLIIRNVWVKDIASNKKFGVMTFLNDEDTLRNGYLYPVSDEGQYQLYYKNQVKFTEGSIPANSFNRPTPNRFSHFKRYFLKIDGKDVAFQLNKNKSSLLKHFPKENRDQAKAFMKKNKISMKDEQDLVKLIDYMNQLTQS
jgi:hypothetical protein